MAALSARTWFVRTHIEKRPTGPDAFIEDLLKLERFLADEGPRGIAATMSFLNLVSRYPREASEIARELGATFVPLMAHDRLEEIVDDRLRLAELRLFKERHVAAEFGEVP